MDTLIVDFTNIFEIYRKILIEILTKAIVRQNLLRL